MPYVPVPAFSRAKLTESAEARWQAVGAARPDLARARPLRGELLGRVRDAAAVLDRGRLPKLSLPPKYLAAKLARGVPALAGEPIPVPVPALRPALLQLCDALAEGGAGDAAMHIREAIESMNIDAGSLLTTSLTRDQSAIRTAAVHRGLSPDLVWLVAELAVSPFAHALQRLLFDKASGRGGDLESPLQQWNRG